MAEASNINDSGILTVSLDFELYWGVRDSRNFEDYKENLQGVRSAIKQMLALFKEYKIHATWATVGLLFADDRKQAIEFEPKTKPDYVNEKLNPYNYLHTLNSDEDCHFAYDLIESISSCEGQEVATHTYSHYYCLERGQDIDSFKSDIDAACKIAKAKNVDFCSLVFPRNQWKKGYLDVLPELGISSFRGNEDHWLYRASNGEERSHFKRAIKLIDTFLNISGHNTYSLWSVDETKPYNFPSSRFLRFYSGKLSFLEGFKKRRIFKSMEYAARNNEVFHLWWHPHNFGVNQKENIQLLKDVLDHYLSLKKEFSMKSLNMKELTEKLDQSSELPDEI